MKMTEVKSIIEAQVSKKGYRLESRKSTTSDSWYFKIYSGDSSLLFRVSDHKTNKNVITLRVDKKMRWKDVENFVNNRCGDLSRRHVSELLGI